MELSTDSLANGVAAPRPDWRFARQRRFHYDASVTSRRIRAISLVLASFLVAAVIVACGGGSGGGSDEEKARKAANDFVLTVLNVFSGNRQPQALIDSFAPECRRGVDASQISAVVALIRLFAPELAAARIQDVDLGEMEVTKSGDRYLVSPKDASQARIRANGQWMQATEFFSRLGLDDAEDLTGGETLAFVIRDGRALVADCDVLQEFAP
jgi:hypothetical protein